MKELYDITELFKIFKRFEKVVRDGKNREKSGKMSEPESPNIYYFGICPFLQRITIVKSTVTNH